MDKIKDLFSRDVDRRIEEVIKVDQTDEEIIHDEISEYVATNPIKESFNEILDRYAETPNKPHEGVGIWVSGFFGAGKSSFAKILGIAIEDRKIKGKPASELVSNQIGDSKISLLLRQISEKIPTDAVVFDVSTEKGVRTSEQPLTEIMYKSLMRHFGYAKDLDLAELELDLEGKDKLSEFKVRFEELHDEPWDKAKILPGMAFSKASVTLNSIDPTGFPSQDSYAKTAANRADVSPGVLADRALSIMERVGSGKSLVFVVDEVGQFVARDVKRMLDLQGIVQTLGRVGMGRMWLIVTSQEKLDELVSGLGDRKVEFARLKDRFPIQVHLEPSDISEVASKRVLMKNAAGQVLLRELFEANRGRLESYTSISADVRLPDLTCDSFISLYPLLPYQIDMIIQIVSGLRSKGGLSQHVGGANRTIIKLAQQLLIHPSSGIAETQIGELVTLDAIYDLIAGNIPSEIRQKIQEIGEKLDNRYAQPVAKAICLLDVTGNIHCTAENIAATLYKSITSDQILPQVREALKLLEEKRMVRQRDGHYKLPTPTEDDWDRIRMSLSPRAHEKTRLIKEELKSLWEPSPNHSLKGVKVFKAGLILDTSEPLVQGDIFFNVFLFDPQENLTERLDEIRDRSRNDDKTIFWVASKGSRIESELVEMYRSMQMISRKQGGARTGPGMALINEEKIRQNEHSSELLRLITQEMISGTIYFRGRDRSATGNEDRITKVAESLLSAVLPEVFHKFELAAVKVKPSSDIAALISHENLSGLPKIYSDLNLLKRSGNALSIAINEEPLCILYDYISEQSSLGDRPSGRQLRNRFGSEPFGWPPEAIMLLTACLVRSGVIEITSKGTRITSFSDPKAKTVLTGNQPFSQASFGTKVPVDKELMIEATRVLKESFGHGVSEINQDKITVAIAEVLKEKKREIDIAYELLSVNKLSGLELMRQVKDTIIEILDNTDEPEACIGSFINSHTSIRDAIIRAAQINSKIDENAIASLEKARTVLRNTWPVLRKESYLDDSFREAASTLEEALKREQFFNSLVQISQLADLIESEYDARHQVAYRERKSKYEEAFVKLTESSDWTELDDEQKALLKTDFAPYLVEERNPQENLGKIKADIDACATRRDQLVEKLFSLISPTEEIETIDIRELMDTNITSDEELENFLEELRKQVQKLLSEGKSVRIK